MCYNWLMSEVISQRELRNDSGRIMRALDEGQSFIVTRHSQPVGELRPMRRQRLVDAHAVTEVFRNAPPLDHEKFLVPRQRLAAGLLDTSVVIDLERIPAELLPEQVAVSVITMAELAAGPAACNDPGERARRQDRLQRAEAVFDPIPFTTEAARAYGRVYSAVLAMGRQPRRRFADLLITSVAIAEKLPLITRNAADFTGLEEMVEIVSIT